MAAGEMTRVSPLVRRLVANNPSPFTFTGTCSYVVGEQELAIIDPGPIDEAHIAALMQAVGGAKVAHVVVTHTHRDHSPAAARIREATGAHIVGARPYQPRPGFTGQFKGLDASHDLAYAPDIVLEDGALVEGRGYTLQAVATPGHAANHLGFALREENALFSGDHVMAWSTSIVAPPDGSMGDYMASLDKLRARGETIFWPGHGGPVREPQRWMRALAHHRRQREASILTRIEAGEGERSSRSSPGSMTGPQTRACRRRPPWSLDTRPSRGSRRQRARDRHGRRTRDVGAVSAGGSRSVRQRRRPRRSFRLRLLLQVGREYFLMRAALGAEVVAA